MRLEKIKLAGFKSFVDPTTVHFASNLNGIVGPNGCGKSNIIDAVRWVMGESSAKQLRGESSTDVIFNGTVERKPIGQASVELVFDNREGKLGGEFAKYTQIAIKRQVNREGQSIYFLNGTKCRRRDVVDVFLGTGLGPRSYAIIEQGTISRLIEAKPEEMRIYLEEVSGISKYKERRRETETRIRHTRENLSRLHDIREEIDKQLSHLQRQANAAERYKILKAEARDLRAQVYCVQWQRLGEEVASVKAALTAGDTTLHADQATRQQFETQLVALREEKHAILDHHNAVQKDFYDCGGEISRLEQTIRHQTERREQLAKDLESAEKEYRHLAALVQEDTTRQTSLRDACDALKQSIVEKKAAHQTAEQALEVAEKALQTWQEAWDAFNTAASSASQKAQVEQTRIQQIEQRQLQQRQRLARITEEESTLAEDTSQAELQTLEAESARLDRALSSQESQYREILTDLEALRLQEKNQRHELDDVKERLQSRKAKVTSLETLQEQALKTHDGKVNAWLKAQGLADRLRLAQMLDVEVGFEKAVEVAIGALLQAVCVDEIPPLQTVLGDLQAGQISFFADRAEATAGTVHPDSLAAKIKAPLSLRAELQAIYCAPDMASALARLPTLAPHEAVVTMDGTYLTRHSLRLARGEDAKSGVIAREQILKTLRRDVSELQTAREAAEAVLLKSQETLSAAESAREAAQQSTQQLKSQLSQVTAKIEVRRAKAEHVRLRLQKLATEATELRDHAAAAQDELSDARAHWQSAMSSMERDCAERETLIAERDDCKAKLTALKAAYQETQAECHRVAMSLEAKEAEAQGLGQAILRMQTQMQLMQTRKSQFELALQADEDPIAVLQTQLADAIGRRAAVETALLASRRRVEENDAQTNTAEKAMRDAEEKITALRASLEEKRMQVQAVSIRQGNLVERLLENDTPLESALAALPEAADESTCTEALSQVERRIERLGPINLAAIEEHRVQEERKLYIDRQYTDLSDALNTLENAIRKIDRETRQRFKETFDQVNTYFKTYFPKIFGGGSAYLELTGDDLLNTGVAVMARPPGKKNTSIHLLSGGEKALTAVSLVFSLFQLNPAPFCLLDEVDAPLDDNNVMRFCHLVKEMAEKVQFLFISHNKLAIEMANQLIGVTMHEPGVSRIVAVDIEEAVAMAEEASEVSL